MDKLDDFLRIREAAEFLGVSPNTLRNWGRAEKIPELRHPLNNYRLYRRCDLEEILRHIREVGSGVPGPDQRPEGEKTSG
jgi:DNA-binding transcriptional MerR regulator